MTTGRRVFGGLLYLSFMLIVPGDSTWILDGIRCRHPLSPITSTIRSPNQDKVQVLFATNPACDTWSCTNEARRRDGGGLMDVESIAFLRELNWRRDERNAEEWKWSVKSMDRYDNETVSYSRLSFSTSTWTHLSEVLSYLFSSFRTLNKSLEDCVYYFSLSYSSFVAWPVSAAEGGDA